MWCKKYIPCINLPEIFASTDFFKSICKHSMGGAEEEEFWCEKLWCQREVNNHKLSRSDHNFLVGIYGGVDAQKRKWFWEYQHDTARNAYSSKRERDNREILADNLPPTMDRVGLFTSPPPSFILLHPPMANNIQWDTFFSPHEATSSGDMRDHACNKTPSW